MLVVGCLLDKGFASFRIQCVACEVVDVYGSATEELMPRKMEDSLASSKRSKRLEPRAASAEGRAMSANYQNADRPVGRYAAAADDKRDHAGDQSDRCHEDRAQSIEICLNDRVVTAHSVRAKVVRMIDLQDRVLFDDTEKQKDTESRKDVQRLAAIAVKNKANGTDSGKVRRSSPDG